MQREESRCLLTQCVTMGVLGTHPCDFIIRILDTISPLDDQDEQEEVVIGMFANFVGAIGMISKGVYRYGILR